MKASRIIITLLLAFTFSNAFFSEMSTRCSGLFLVDQTDALLKGSGCQTRESVSVANWNFRAAVGKFHSEGLFHYDHKNSLYAWTLSSENDLQLNQVSVDKEFDYISYGLDLSSRPFYRARVALHAKDSLLFARASLAFSNPEILNIRWESASSLSIIPKLDATWKDSVHVLDFSIGTKINQFLAEVGFNYGWSTPDAEERYGYLISDSSYFWGISPRLRYTNSVSSLEIGYNYEYADLYLMGLLREKDNEKRFFYLPLGLNLNWFYARYNRQIHNKDNLTAALMFGKFFAKIPWEKRRFYETFAPNRALTRSIIKTLSFATYTRNFRAGGNGDAEIIAGEFGYNWNRNFSAVTIKPAVKADIIMGTAEGNLYIQKESQGLLWIDKQLDTLGRKFSVAGAVLNADFAVENPTGNIYAQLGIGQIVPFYFNKTKKRLQKEEVPSTPPPSNNGENPPPSVTPSEPNPPDDGKEENEPPKKLVETTHNKSLQDYFSDISKYAFTNGFSIQFEIGIRF